jgi:MFS family permease
LAAPFAAGALFLPNPWCFLSLIPSNVIGEMWIGVTTAIVVDLAPSKIRTAALGLYLFIITVIGGNFNLLVAPIQKGFGKHMSDLLSYRLALLFTFPGVYAISSGLFVLAFFLMRLDLKHKMHFEKTMVVNQEEKADPTGGSDEDEVENQGSVNRPV